MKKTITISLGGMSFQIEEDAYTRLDEYLKEVKSHFASYPDSEEIVNDIESRIAEQLTEKAGTFKIVTLPIVEELISVMGTPQQFGDEPAKESAARGESKRQKAPGKRLYRDPDNTIIGGVCSGIAAYLGEIDPVWVRLAFALSIFFGGFGIILYIILWIIMPEAQTDTEKMQMRGRAVNLKNVEAMLKDRVEEFKKNDHSQIKKLFTLPFAVLAAGLRALGKFLKKLFPILSKIIGALLILVVSLTLAALVFTAVTLIFNADSPYVEFPLREIANNGGIYYTAVISAFLVIFVPLLYLLFLGTSLLSFKSIVNRMGNLLLLAVWIIAISIFASMAIKLAPQVENILQSSQYYQTEIREIDVSGFSKLDIGSSYEVVLHVSETYAVTAEGRQDDLDRLQSEIEGEELTLRRRDKFQICLFCSSKSIKLEIYAPEINEIKLSGASRLSSTETLSSISNIRLSGASRAELALEVPTLNMRLSGASRLQATGTIENLILTLSSASQADAENALVSNIEADLSGASKAYFNEVNDLKANLSGASRIYYSSTQTIQIDASGSSRALRN